MSKGCWALIIFVLMLLTPSLNAYALDMKVNDIKTLNIAVELPADFTEMPDDWVKIKYPSRNRPQAVYSNDSGSVSFGISKMKKPDLIALSEIKDAMLRSMSRFNPQASSFTVDGYDAWIISFRSQAIDSELLNMQLITVTKNDFIIATFNMNESNIGTYKEVGIKSLLSIKFK
ncbi:TPA: hypothetical protein ACGCBI_000521 [Serratia marcescens]